MVLFEQLRINQTKLVKTASLSFAKMPKQCSNKNYCHRSTLKGSTVPYPTVCLLFQFLKMTSEAISMLRLCCVCHDSSLLAVVHNTGEYADKCGYETVWRICATGSICGNSSHTAEHAPIAPRLPDPFSLLHCSVSAMLQSWLQRLL